jgi:hypothetical protein
MPMVDRSRVRVPVILPRSGDPSAGADHSIQRITLRVGDYLDRGVVVETVFVSHPVTSCVWCRAVRAPSVTSRLASAWFGLESHLAEVLFVLVADVLAGHVPDPVPSAVRAFRGVGD